MAKCKLYFEGRNELWKIVNETSIPFSEAKLNIFVKCLFLLTNIVAKDVFMISPRFIKK